MSVFNQCGEATIIVAKNVLSASAVCALIILKIYMLFHKQLIVDVKKKKVFTHWVPGRLVSSAKKFTEQKET